MLLSQKKLLKTNGLDHECQTHSYPNIDQQKMTFTCSIEFLDFIDKDLLNFNQTSGTDSINISIYACLYNISLREKLFIKA